MTGGNVLGGDRGECPRGTCPGGNVQGGKDRGEMPRGGGSPDTIEPCTR